MAWAEGSKPCNVEALVRRGLACNALGIQDTPQNLDEAFAVVSALAEYVLSLPEEKQSVTARALVSALGDKQAYRSTVKLKGNK